VKVIRLERNDSIYTCNSYLILGAWNRIEDINTLIDPGTDGSVMEEIERLSTGLGKVAVEQIILTHNHFDHAGGVAHFKEAYGCSVLAFAPGEHVDRCLKDGELLRAGDGYLEILHTPGHSWDSISLYSQIDETLFSGDMQLRVAKNGGIHTAAYFSSLLKISNRQICTILSGHDQPVEHGARELILTSLAHVRQGKIAGQS
jgi:glyoxylase-like metal-dependent hydrolase (beta-lactamase superfamily II)